MKYPQTGPAERAQFFAGVIIPDVTTSSKQCAKKDEDTLHIKPSLALSCTKVQDWKKKLKKKVNLSTVDDQ